MNTQVEAVYENGVFRPLRPVHLLEQQHVIVTFDDEKEADTANAMPVHFMLSEDRWQAFCDALDAPPKDLPALKKLLTGTSRFDGNGTAVS
jgi:predicted DNA-binding antitoxin AbrB/MazE fold protein